MAACFRCGAPNWSEYHRCLQGVTIHAEMAGKPLWLGPWKMSDDGQWFFRPVLECGRRFMFGVRVSPRRVRPLVAGR